MDVWRPEERLPTATWGAVREGEVRVDIKERVVDIDNNKLNSRNQIMGPVSDTSGSSTEYHGTTRIQDSGKPGGARDHSRVPR